MKKLILCFLLFNIILGCSSTKTTIADNHPIHSLVSSKSYQFTADWANPMVTQSLTAISNSGLIPPGSNISRINLAGNSNYLKMDEDSISAILPYYGERQSGGGYGASSGIEFNGIPKDYQQIFDIKSSTYSINFTINNSIEQYFIRMTIFPNKSTTVTVNSNNRNSIRYDGEIEEIK
ncbi:DUF4251 domain-containing protein [Maribacter hydrothermalis]|uniref:DUF4251 domain-containing protein n=1 Tax=Maribacter hydrothermalis TaxID=1836467 RepID=A0A1B7Z878_9FLAO|nr:DUF4251 domain-containing protein [Maribacter hydrothermalis]APQ19067.1 hypothetical protein BTR34_17845 [Maribacter hydrothermalis]OBR38921.1 hypothetical protein A9200_04440 [Maribacter hydrothermalis]